VNADVLGEYADPIFSFEIYSTRNWLSYIGNILTLKMGHLFSQPQFLIVMRNRMCPLKSLLSCLTVPAGLDKAPFLYPHLSQSDGLPWNVPI
jgi:hypothetical protein